MIVAAEMIVALTVVSVLPRFPRVGAHASDVGGTDERISIGRSSIEVRFASGDIVLPRARLLAWIRKSACAVAEYYGRFPVPNATVEVAAADEGSGVLSGRTIVIDQAPLIRVIVAKSASESALREDWILTHEMVHLAFPSVPRQHHWIEEGIATYVEPIARAQIGELTNEKVWRDLMDGVPRGLPAPGDQGLDNTHTWGRTYWGGALFCLMADVEIHRRTNDRFGLQDALRGIGRAGGNMNYDWPLARALKAGDDAVGVPVLSELYNQMKATPLTPDLPALWRELGVRPSGGSVAFDQTAPLSSVVRSIMARRSEPAAPCRRGGGA
jgi:hypothetical protein